jgi:Flp pilus assembly pilin Flp
MQISIQNTPKETNMKMFTRRFGSRRGAAILEYSLLVAGIALIAAASVATFGHKTNDMLGMVAAVIPGAHTDDNAPIVSGRIIETGLTANKGTAIGLDIDTIVTNSDGKTKRLGADLGLDGDVTKLVVEPQ